MATGTYGIVSPADISPDDVEIFYHYTPSRDKVGNTGLIKLNPSDVLSRMDNPNKTQSNVTGFEVFGGMYTLKLPVATFNTLYKRYLNPLSYEKAGFATPKKTGRET